MVHNVAMWLLAFSQPTLLKGKGGVLYCMRNLKVVLCAYPPPQRLNPETSVYKDRRFEGDEVCPALQLEIHQGSVRSEANKDHAANLLDRTAFKAELGT